MGSLQEIATPCHTATDRRVDTTAIATRKIERPQSVWYTLRRPTECPEMLPDPEAIEMLTHENAEKRGGKLTDEVIV